MMSRLLLHLTSSLLLLAVALVAALPMVAAVCATAPFPPMAPGHSPGCVSGAILTNTSRGIAGASVSIVNSANNSVVYFTTTTDSGGSFSFAYVNSTNGSAVYRLFATAIGYDNGTSSAFAVGSGTTASLNVVLSRNYSVATPSPTPVPGPGDVAGYVTTGNASKGVSGAKVSLVQATNPYVPLTSTTTDGIGRFTFGGVAYLASPGYQLKVEKEGYESKFSKPFQIVSGLEVRKDVSLNSTGGSDSGNTTVKKDVDTKATPTLRPATSTPAAKPAVPGFEALAALAGIVLVAAVARKR